jgi:hypothetical protein
VRQAISIKVRHATNETIDDIRRKNFLAIPFITDQLLINALSDLATP